MKGKIKGVVLSILFLGMLVVPNSSSADIISDLQAQISALLAQVQQLQERLTQQIGQPTEEWCHTFNVSLKYGDSGKEVEALETALVKEGFSPDEKGDYFGEQTASAVVGFQQKYKSEILNPWGMSYGTGYVGKTTREKLNALYGCGNVVISEPVCAKEGKQFSSVYKDSYPEKCCSGLMEWYSGMDTRKVVDGKCVETGLVSGSPIGTCINCGNGICESVENICNCPKDCSSTQNQNPVITGVSGPTNLNVNQSGTWTIKAYDPNGTYLSYSVDWGDRDIIGRSLSNTSTKSETTSQSATFSHSYSTAGNYTVTMKVTDKQGLLAKSSITVKIGGGSTTTCTDSDGGKNYYIKGTATGLENGQTVTSTDGCRYDNVTLAEVYCDGKYLKVEQHTCPNGCSYGACVTTGQLLIQLDSSSPARRDVAGGTDDAVLGIFKFSAINEPIDLKRIALQLMDKAASPQDLNKITLWDGSTHIGSGVFTNNYQAILTLTGSFVIPADDSKRLTVKGAIACVGVSCPGTVGHLIRVGYDGDATSGTYGYGKTSGNKIYPITKTDVYPAGVMISDPSQVSSPELAVTDFYVYRKDSSNVNFYYCIRNIGSASAGKFYLKFLNLSNPSWDFGGAGFDGLGVNEKYCSEVGRSGVYSGGGNGYVSGENRIKVFVDSNHEVSELNESNNELTFTFNTIISSNPINGSCGSANGQTFTSAPASNLCNAGNASSITEEDWKGDSIRYTWSCSGFYGGSGSTCYAYNMNTTPSITVTSKYKGETWIKGNTYPIQWSKKGLTASDIVFSIRLRPVEGGMPGPIIEEYPNIVAGLKNDSSATQRYNWTIPTSLNDGSYMLQILSFSSQNSQDNVEDFSDWPFSIVAPAISIPQGCTDSDGGKDYYTKGTVYDNRETPPQIDDFCYDSNQLFEHECEALGYSAGLYTCPNGCNDGVCVVGTTNNAQIISQSVPTTMTAGQTYQASVVVKNTGNTIWTKSGSYPYRLGAQNPRDNCNWIYSSRCNRVELLDGEAVEPGKTKIFTFDVNAPTTPGTYNFQWRMVHENKEWFGDRTNTEIINVISSISDNRESVNQLANILESARGMLRQMLDSLK